MNISINLSESSIDSAIQQVEQYKTTMIQKCELFRQRVAEAIQDKAQQGFSGAIVDDLLNDSPVRASVDVVLNPGTGNVTTVIAKGTDAVWVEFGTGVHHNTKAGDSPHPKGNELKMTIGGYGYGNGAKDTWGYYVGEGKDEQLFLTQGAPAKMPMYRAVKEVAENIYSIAKEVFG